METAAQAESLYFRSQYTNVGWSCGGFTKSVQAWPRWSWAKCNRHIWRGYVPHATADTLFAPPTSVTSHRVWRANADFGDAMAWNNELIKHISLRKTSQCNFTEYVLRILVIYSIQRLDFGRIRRNTAIETILEKQCDYVRARITCNILVMRQNVGIRHKGHSNYPLSCVDLRDIDHLQLRPFTYHWSSYVPYQNSSRW